MRSVSRDITNDADRHEVTACTVPHLAEPRTIKIYLNPTVSADSDLSVARAALSLSTRSTLATRVVHPHAAPCHTATHCQTAAEPRYRLLLVAWASECCRAHETCPLVESLRMPTLPEFDSLICFWASVLHRPSPPYCHLSVAISRSSSAACGVKRRREEAV